MEQTMKADMILGFPDQIMEENLASLSSTATRIH